MSNFYVGQKVVCLKTGPWRWEGNPSYDGPHRNEILVVTEIDEEEQTGLIFLELAGYEPHTYWSIHFRPLDEYDQSEDLTRELATKLLERIVHEELDIIS